MTPDFVLAAEPRCRHRGDGFVPKRLPFPAARPRVFNVWQVLKGEADLGERVLFIDDDGHHQATSTANTWPSLGRRCMS